MKTLTGFLVAVLIPAALLAQAPNQTIRLRDGNEMQGIVVRSDGRDITFREPNGNLRRVRFDQIETIDFNRPRGEGRYRNDRGPGDAYVTPPPPPPPPSRAPLYQDRDRVMGVPAGADVQIRTNETIDSRDASETRTYAAQVDQDVRDARGDVVIPAGSNAWLVVRRINNNQIALDLQSVAINGDRYNIDAEAITAGQQGFGGNRRTGEFVGTGAVLGAVIGAIAGGGKGAGIGALAGGAAGAGAQALTKGDHVRVPAEVILDFRLEAPIRLNRLR